MMGALESRLRGMISRAIVRLVDDAREAQELQLELLADEGQDGVEHLHPYGFTAHPHPDAEAIVACVGGLRSHMIALVVGDRRYRLKGLAAGEVALHDDLGNMIKLGRNRIEITGTSEVTVTTPIAKVISNDVRLGGDGGKKVARVGDLVVGGVITTGSSKVRAT
jgi:phage baseplate assembly protein V